MKREISEIFFISLLLVGALLYPSYSQTVNEPSLSVEPFISGLNSPTSFAFLNNSDILVLEKDGTVRLISNGVLAEEPVLTVSVNTESERGLLGIAVRDSDVFLYYTESGEELRNRVYKYQWNGQALINPVLMLDLPAIPGPNHDGGKLLLGQDGYLYVIIGDLNHDGQLQNFPEGPPPDDTGIILRINPDDGSPAPGNPFSNVAGMEKYYAYGIRNSFGIDIDPVTGNLWDTENGPSEYDEINLVNPGFNSGWQTVMGPIDRSGESESGLVNFPGSQYSDPIFSWLVPPAITDLEFFDSQNFGDKYSNNLFVGDNNNGNLYFFTVSSDRSSFVLTGSVQDKVADNENEMSSITFGSGFGSITDIETGPDKDLYVLSFDEGILYRISATNSSGGSSVAAQPSVSPSGSAATIPQVESGQDESDEENEESDEENEESDEENEESDE